MAPDFPTPPARAFALAALLVAAALAGCAAPQRPVERAQLADAVANTAPMTWAEGNWWAYQATAQNRTLDVALIVAQRTADGIVLGTNASAGFFGLPFHGNVTRDLNPMIGPEEWPLYRFPLADGKTWEYKLFGYDAKTVARAAMVDVPGVGPSPGFTLEASSFGRVFATYDYSPHAGWFTRLSLIEPTKQETLLHARLVDFGASYGEGYYVERALHEARIDYPGLPGTREVRIPSGYARADVLLTAAGEAAVIDATLLDADGREMAKARALAKGGEVARVSVEGARTWTLDHKGAGKGFVYLVVTGLVSVGEPDAERAEHGGMHLSLLDALQSTLPARPHTGHVTSTGWPVAV